MKGLVDEKKLAGVVTLMARHGKVVHFTAHGQKDVRQPAALTKDSIFRIYSMTKPVTGVAMLMLYEEGKWRLDDPVSRYIPEFAKLVVYVGENPDGTLKTEPARRSMTMRELMTHTGGLAYGLVGAHPVDKLFVQANVLDSTQPLQAMIDKIARLPLLAQPGTRWSYSVAVDVQGYLVEKLSGMSFADFLKTRLFAPLGMKDTAFYVPAEKATALARIHRVRRGRSRSWPSDREGDPTIVPAAGFGGHGLFSTASDYARFAQMLLDGGELGGVRMLAPRTVEMFRTNHVLAEPLKTMREGQGWGLGAQVITDAAASGEPYSDGSFHWWGIGGHLVLGRSGEDLAVRRHDPIPGAQPDECDPDSRVCQEPRLSGRDGVRRAVVRYCTAKARSTLPGPPTPATVAGAREQHAAGDDRSADRRSIRRCAARRSPCRSRAPCRSPR